MYANLLAEIDTTQLTVALAEAGAFLFAIWVAHRNSIERIATMEVKVNTMWEFQMRRAQGEAVQTGIATKNSPLIFTEESKAWLSDIAPAMQAFYNDKGKNLGDTDLAIEIERMWGEHILDTVCIPRKLSHGACLLLAIEVARGDHAGMSGAHAILPPEGQK